MRIFFLFLAVVIITGCSPAVPKHIDADKVTTEIKNLNYISRADLDGDDEDDLFLIFCKTVGNDNSTYTVDGIYAYYKKENN
jgi:hypothetical protein